MMPYLPSFLRVLLPAHFHFLHPLWLWALIVLPLVLLLVWWQQRRQLAFRQLVDDALLPHLLEGKKGGTLGQLLLAGLIWLLACLALAGPSWKQYPTPLLESQSAQVIALSLSKTMYANDVAPDRLTRARFKVHDLLNANAAGMNGLIGFAGEAFVVAPLTRDSNSLSALLNAMSPDTMPVDGDNAAAAIRRAQTLLKEADTQHGLIILITDDANQATVDEARTARNGGLRVSVLGIGSNKRQPVTLPDGSLLHDTAGNLVLTQRNDTRLAAVANAGGGIYVAATNNDADVRQLETGLESSGPQERRKVSHWRDMGPWLLLPLVLLFAASFRRGWLLLLLLFPLAMPHPAQAADWQQRWQNLWQRPDQQAASALANQQPALAEKLAKSPEWKGVAAYQAKHYKKAIDAFQHTDDANTDYNLGNALAQSGNLKGAIASYKKAIAQHPDDTDARHNLDVVEKLLKQRQDKDQNKKQDNGQDKNSSKNDQQKNDKSQQQNGKGENEGEENQDQSGKHNSQNSSSNSSQEENDKQHPGAADSQQPKPESAEQQKADKQAAQRAQQNLKQEMDKALNDKALNQKSLQKPAEQSQVNNLGALSKENPMQKLPPSTRQLLMAVPDDPGALLKRKFELEYQQRQSQGDH
jgi:Ca-activated chloride channel family protein